MTEAHTKELISRAYVNALAARVGMTVANASLDYGFDGTFKATPHKLQSFRLAEVYQHILWITSAVLPGKAH